MENGILVILLVGAGLIVGYLLGQYGLPKFKQTEILQALTESLNATLTIEQIAEVIVNDGLNRLHSGTSSIYLLLEDSETLELVKLKAIPEKIYQQYRRISLNLPGPLTDALRTGQPVWINSSEEYAARYPTLAAVIRENKTQSSACIPFVIDNRVTGGITISFHKSNLLTDERKALLVTIARQCGQAVERARVYQQLFLQEERYRVTLESIGDAVIAADTNGKIIFMNTVACNLTRWSDGIGQRLSDVFNIINETTREKVESPFDKVIREGAIVGLANHTLLITRDGAEMPIDDSGAPIRNKAGELVGVVLVFRDISERKEAERQIQRSEDRYRAFVANSSEGIWRFELEQPFDITLPSVEQIELFYRYGYLAECNNTMAQMYGYQRADEIEGARLGDLLVQSSPENMAYLTAFVESGYRLTDVESDERDAAGQTRYFLNSLVGIVEDGQLRRAWGIQRDVTQQKQIQVALQQAQADAETARNNLYNLFMEAPALIGILRTREGIVELFNPLFRRLWGDRDVMGKPMREAFHELKGQGWFEIVQQVYDTGQSVVGKEREAWFDRDNNGELEQGFFNFVYQPVHNSAGDVDGVAIFGVEITEQVIARKQAEANEAQLRLVLEASKMAVWDWDLLTDTSTRSIEHEHIFGYEAPVEAWNYAAFIGHVIPEDRPMIDNKFQEARQSGDFEVECRIQRTDNAIRWIYIKGQTFYDVEQMPVRMVGIMLDITERKQVEKTLFETRERLQMMIQSMKDHAIFTTDIHGMINTWNSGAEQVFGYLQSEIIGQNLAIIFTPEDRAAGIPELERNKALAEGYAEDERWHLRRNGQRFFASGMTHPMWDQSGNLRGFIKVGRDMTERKQAEEMRAELLRLEQMARAEAEKANQLKLQFLAMISHELRTPLTSIKGFTSTLLAEDVAFDTQSQHDFIQIMDTEADKLNELIEQLLDVSQLQAGTLRIQPVLSSFEEVISTAEVQLQTLTRQHDYVQSIQINLPTVKVDPNRIAQVLVNLVGNAVKYSPIRSEITLSAEQKEAFIVVSVTDEGQGIPLEDRPYIFDPFRQAHRGSQKGAGLGLAICKGIIEAHGGQIWIAPEPTSGTTVSFTLPINPE